MRASLISKTPPNQETYSEETIQGFIDVFPSRTASLIN